MMARRPRLLIAARIERRIRTHSSSSQSWRICFSPAEGAPLNDVIGHSITYRVAVGPRTGQKVFMLRSLSAERA
jgi:hypothetical protein